MKRTAVGAITVLVLVCRLIGAAPEQQNDRTSIDGVVLRAGTNEPVGDAQVVLMRVPPSGPGQATSAMTDSGGKFVLRDVAPGGYRLSVSRDSFVRQEFGSRRIGQTGVGTILNVSGQPIKDVVIHLTSTGSVTGRVLNPTGDPLSRFEVHALRQVFDANGRSFQVVASAQTDDRGAYRLYWLTPGRYYVAAGPSTRFSTLPPQLSASNPKTYLTTIYPNATDAAAAVAVDVRPAVDVNGIDIALRQVQTYRVRGRVTDALTGRLPAGQVTFSIVPRHPVVSTITSPASATNTDGTFELRDVPPGEFWLRAQASLPRSSATAPPQTETALVPLNVGEADVEDLVIVLQPGVTVSGRFMVEGQPESISTTLRPTIRLAPLAAAFSPGAPAFPSVNPDGTFSQANVAPGDYRLLVLGLPQDYYVKEAGFGGVDAPGKPIAIAGPVSEKLSIVVSPKAGQISGMISDDRQQAVAGALVALIPDRLRPRTDLYKSVTTDASGRFTIGGITPGDYKLFAWEDLESGAYFDPGLLQKFETTGKPVHILESSRETVNMTVIPGESQ